MGGEGQLVQLGVDGAVAARCARDLQAFHGDSDRIVDRQVLVLESRGHADGDLDAPSIELLRQCLDEAFTESLEGGGPLGLRDHHAGRLAAHQDGDGSSAGADVRARTERLDGQ